MMPRDIFKNKKIHLGFDPKIITKKFLNTFFGKSQKLSLPLKKI